MTTAVRTKDKEGKAHIPLQVEDDRSGGLRRGPASTFVLAAYDSSPATKATADLICDGTNDELTLKVLLDRLPSSGGEVYIAEGTYTFSFTNLPLDLTTGEWIRLSGGATINCSGGAGNGFVFRWNGTSTAVARSGIRGYGKITVTGSTNEGLLFDGDVQDFAVGRIVLQHIAPSTNQARGIVLRGGAGWGVRDWDIRAVLVGWAQDSSGEEGGGLFMESMCGRGTSHCEIRTVSYGISAFFRDVAPTRVTMWDNSAAAFVNKANARDSDTTTNVAVDLDADDYLAVGLTASVFNSIRWFISSGNTTLAYMKADVYDGSTWTNVPLSVNETVGANAPWQQGGETVWKLPKESLWAAATLDGVSAYWIRFRFVDSSGVTANIASITLDEVLIGRIPYSVELYGTVRETLKAGVQLRCSHRFRQYLTLEDITTHAINWNSHSTETLANGDLQNDRWFKSRWNHDYSNVDGALDTLFLTRCADSVFLHGTYINGVVGWEMGSSAPANIDDDQHRTTNSRFDGFIGWMNSEGVRLTSGSNNYIGGTIINCGLDVTAALATRTLVRVKTATGMSLPSNNVFAFNGHDTHGVVFTQYGIYVDSDCTATNYMLDCHLSGTFGTATILDNAQSLEVVGETTAGGAFTAQQTDDSASVQLGVFNLLRTTGANDDEGYLSLQLTRNATPSTLTEVFRLTGRITDVTGGSPSGGFRMHVRQNPSGLVEFLRSWADSSDVLSTVINEDGLDWDFRIESNDDANMLFLDAGNNRIGIGTGSPATDLEIQGAGSASTVQIDTDGASADSGLAVAENGTIKGYFFWDTSESSVSIQTPNNVHIDFLTSSALRMRVDQAGNVGIGTGTATPTGLLNLAQGAADNEILVFESSDVLTVLTNAPTETVKTTDFATFSKSSGAEGGLLIQALMEDVNARGVFRVHAYGGQGSNTKSTSARSLIEFYASEHDGANLLTDITADGNVFGVMCRRGGADTTVFIIDEDGDVHSDVSTAMSTFDTYDDIKLITALRAEMSRDINFKAMFGEMIAPYRGILVANGVLSDQGFVSWKGMAGLTIDAVRQLAARVAKLEAARG